MKTPLVTILLCTKDRPDLLLRCLQSLQDLEFDSFEVILVDNGSKDFRIPEIKLDFPIRYFEQPVKGISYARNYTLPHCAGEYVALIDDDAIAHRDWLTCSMKHFSDNAVGCVTGKILPVQVTTEWQKRYFDEGWLPAWNDSKSFHLKSYDPFTTPAGAGTNVVVRKTVLMECKFPEFLGAGTAVGAEDDHYLFYRVMKLGWKVIYDPESIVYHPCPQSEEEYTRLITRSTSSRSAYILRFLLSEPGYRLHALRHIFSKLFRPKTRRIEMDVGIRTRGFVSGALALVRALSDVRKHHIRATQSLREITVEGLSPEPTSR